MTKKIKSFYNKRILLHTLYKEYPDINFELVLFPTGNKYILLWEYNNKINNINDLFENLKEYNKKEEEIKNKVLEIIKNTKTSSKKTIPQIDVQHRVIYYEFFHKPLYPIMDIEKRQINFPYQKSISNAEYIIRELIKTMFTTTTTILLKGSVSAYICYGIGNKIPFDINISCTYFDMYKFIELIEEYCKMNNLSYETDFKYYDKYSNFKTKLIRTNIKIQNCINFTFDNAIEVYKILKNDINIINNIPTYTLEKLIELKQYQIKNYQRNKKTKSKEKYLLNKYKEKLKEINNKKGE